MGLNLSNRQIAAELGLTNRPFRVFLGLGETGLRSGNSMNFATGDAPWTPHRRNQHHATAAHSRRNLASNLSKTPSVQVGVQSVWVDRKRGAWIHNKKLRNVNRLTAEQNLAALLVRNVMRRNLGF